MAKKKKIWQETGKDNDLQDQKRRKQAQKAETPKPKSGGGQKSSGADSGSQKRKSVLTDSSRQPEQGSRARSSLQQFGSKAKGKTAWEDAKKQGYNPMFRNRETYDQWKRSEVLRLAQEKPKPIVQQPQQTPYQQALQDAAGQAQQQPESEQQSTGSAALDALRDKLERDKKAKMAPKVREAWRQSVLTGQAQLMPERQQRQMDARQLLNQERRSEQLKARQERDYERAARSYGKHVTEDINAGDAAYRKAMLRSYDDIKAEQQTALKEMNDAWQNYLKVRDSENTSSYQQDPKKARDAQERVRAAYEDYTSKRRNYNMLGQAAPQRQNIDRAEDIEKTTAGVLAMPDYDDSIALQALQQQRQLIYGEHRSKGEDPDDYYYLMDYMSPEEKRAYGYLLAFDMRQEKDPQERNRIAMAKSDKDGTAKQYLDTLRSDLKRRRDMQQAREEYVPDKEDKFFGHLWKDVKYVVQGLNEGARTGIGFTNQSHQGKLLDLAREAYSSDHKDSPFLARLYRDLGGAAYSVGQMLPAMAAGQFAGALTGALSSGVAGSGALSASNAAGTAASMTQYARDAAFYASTKARAQKEAKQRGMTDVQAEIYSTLIGLSETKLQEILGGISKMGGLNEGIVGQRINMIDNAFIRVSAHIGAGYAGEIGEELIQDWLDPAFVTIITGADFEAPTASDMLDTILSTAMMVSGTNVGDTVSYANQTKIRSNLRRIEKDARLLGQTDSSYLRLAESINDYIAEVDANPDTMRYTRQSLYEVLNWKNWVDTSVEDAQADSSADGRDGQAERQTKQGNGLDGNNPGLGRVGENGGAAEVQTQGPGTVQSGQSAAVRQQGQVLQQGTQQTQQAGQFQQFQQGQQALQQGPVLQQAQQTQQQALQQNDLQVRQGEQAQTKQTGQIQQGQQALQQNDLQVRQGEQAQTKQTGQIQQGQQALQQTGQQSQSYQAARQQAVQEAAGMTTDQLTQEIGKAQTQLGRTQSGVTSEALQGRSDGLIYAFGRQQAIQEAAGMSAEQVSQEIGSAQNELGRTQNSGTAELLQGRIDGLQEAAGREGAPMKRAPGGEAGRAGAPAEAAAQTDNGLGGGNPALGRAEQSNGAAYGAQNGQTENNLISAQAETGRGESYGTATGQGLNAGVQRNDGLGADRQTRAVEGRAGGQVAGSAAARTDAQKKAAIAVLGTQRQSAQEIGIRGGSQTQNLQVISDRSLYTSDMERAEADARANGMQITFVRGKIEVWNPQTKQYDIAQAIRQGNEDGSTSFFIRADLRSVSAGQLYEHELFHSMMRNNPQLRQQMIDYMTENYTPEQIERFLGRYVEACRGIYGTDEAAIDRYLEEALADAYAEMKRNGIDIAPARETVGAFREQTQENRQNLAATDRTTGPPELGAGNGLAGNNPGLGQAGEQQYSMEFDEETETEQNSDRDYLDAVERGDTETAQRMVDEAARSGGWTIHAFHGTARGDRVGTVFRPDRATSGPMAFFTSDKAIADSYAKSKQDTSMAYDSDYDSYETQFRAKTKKGAKFPIDTRIGKAWGYIDITKRNEIREKAGQLRFDWDGDDDTAFILDPDNKEAGGGFQWQLKRARGNVIDALVEQWLNSGNLFDEEARFLEVLKMVGITDELKRVGLEVEYKDPQYREEKTYDVFLKMTRPFDTSKATRRFIDNLVKWYDKQPFGKYDRESASADLWDKNNVTIDEFIERLEGDLKNKYTHAWTSVPDFVTDYLKHLHYDSIIDKGGKFTDNEHTVYIPFDSEQVKSAEPVVYDDNGKVIPLSERFRTDRQGDEAWKNEDIRYSMDFDEEEGSAEDEKLGMLDTGPEVFGERFAEVARAPWYRPQNTQDNGLDVREPGLGKKDAAESSGRKQQNRQSKAQQDNGLGRKNPGLGSSEALDALVEQEDAMDRRIAEKKKAAEEQRRRRTQNALEKKRSNAKKASEQTLKNQVRELERTVKQLDKMEKSGYWNDSLEARRKNLKQTLEIDREVLAEKTAERKAGTTTQKQLRESISENRAELAALKTAEKSGELSQEQLQRREELEQELEQNNRQLEKLRDRQRDKKAQKKEIQLEKQPPRQARKEFRQDALNLFSIPAERRQAMSTVLNEFADKALEKGTVSYQDRQELIRELYEQGVEILPADEYYSNLRRAVQGRRVYVNEQVRQEFGDDWEAFRRQAWSNGIYLTNRQSDPGVDVWVKEMAEVFPDSFDAQETDLRRALEGIVQLAEEGKDQKISLEEMMRQNERQTGQSIDSQMDELEQKVDQLIDKFAEKAQLEIRMREQSAMRRALERQDNRERVERAAEAKRQNEKRIELLKKIKTLQKMRKTAGPEHRKQIDSIVKDIDTVARSISPAGIENLQQLAKDYEELCKDPNFIRNPNVEERIGRLAKTQINDLDIRTVEEMIKAVSGMITTVEASKKMLADEQHRKVSDVAHRAAQEIMDSSGSDGGWVDYWFRNEHLDATRYIRMLGGFLKGGAMDSLAQELVDGGTKKIDYMRQATRLFDAFVNNKDNRNWLTKASGKNAEWIKISVPAFDFYGKVTQTDLEITPMMRVALYMHSLNDDNMLHISEGGIRIPEKKAYIKGDMKQAYAKGKRVLLTPEMVYEITKGMTKQERAFAKLLATYFDDFSAERINEVSMQIDGFERAGMSRYFHIKVDQSYLREAENEQVRKDISLESISSIVNARTHSEVPILLEDASSALLEHIDTISSYYGYTVPIRDFNAVLQYTFFGKPSENTPSVFQSSVKEILLNKWSAEAEKTINKLMKDLQERGGGKNSRIAAALASIRGKLAGASLSFNLAVTLSQIASLPGAAAIVGWNSILSAVGHVANPRSRIDMNLIELYSPVLWYRNQGNSTQELGDYMRDKGLEGKLPWLLGWIQKFDSGTIKALWYAAEHRVSKDTDLAPGSEEEVQAGTDPYYMAVAKVFNQMVYETQPNYTTMQRPQILRSENELMKYLTMFKTVPLQYYNIMFESVGRYHNDMQRLRANKTNTNKAAAKASGKALVNALTGVIGANVMYVMIKAAVKGGLLGNDKYEDDEDKFNLLKAWPQLLKDFADTCVGSFIGGNEIMEYAPKIVNAFKEGKWNWNTSGGLEISSLEGLEDLVSAVGKIAAQAGKQDEAGIRGAIKDAAVQFGMLSGVPVRNAVNYIGSIVKMISPEAAYRVENFFDEVEKKDLSEAEKQELRAAIGQLMDNRTEDLKDETVDELMRLWQEGGSAAIPGGVPFKISLAGEGETEEETEDEETEYEETEEDEGAGGLELGFRERRTYRETWSRIVSGSLEELMASDLYQAADDEHRTKIINLLYRYADDEACAMISGDATREPWHAKAKAKVDKGSSVEDMICERIAETMQPAKIRELSGDYQTEIIRLRLAQRADVSSNTLSELQRLFNDGASTLPPEFKGKYDITGDDGEKTEYRLTDEEKDVYLENWNATVSGALDRLLESETYKNASDKEKSSLISKLYRYASDTSKVIVLPDSDLDKWKAVGRDAVKSGVPLDEYILFHAAVSKLDAKDEEGKSIDGLKNQRGLNLLDSFKWTDKQKEQIYMDISLSSEALEKQEKAMRQAGMTWKQTAEVLNVVGNDWAHAQVIINQNTSDQTKIKALELYLGEKDYKAAYSGYVYSVDLKLWMDAKNKADVNGNGNGTIDQKEATAYLNTIDADRDVKAYLWQMLCTTSKAKNNPYSTTWGQDFWEYMQTVEKP